MRSRRPLALLVFALLVGALNPLRAQEDAPGPAAPVADWITPSDAVPDARFGADVALIDGPAGTRLVVGAPGATGERPGTGAAYVFTYDRDRLAWVEAAKLTAPDGLPGDAFGARVDATADTLRIGAAEAVYTFVADSLGWRYLDQRAGALPEAPPGAGSNYTDLDGRAYQARALIDQEEVQVLIAVRTDVDAPMRATQAALLTDPDLRASDLADATMAFDGRFLALGTPGTDEGGAVYVWTLGAHWRADDLAPTLPGLQAKAGPEDYVEVDVFYGTDRARTGRRNPRRFYGGRRGTLELGVATVTIPKSHEVGRLESPSLFRLQFRANPAKHVILKAVEPLHPDSTVAQMRAALDSTSTRAVLLYVHGFNVSFEDAARRAAQMAFDLEFDGVPAFYSWPSDASLIRYLSDASDVQWSVFHLKEFLRRVAQQAGAEDVHVVAHSMGNRAVTQALREFACEFKAPQFNQVILAAPDVDAEVFTRDIAPAIAGAAEQITLYTSADDTALRVSQALHGAPRAGNSLVTAMGVTTIDASGLDPSLLGHSYYADLKQLLDDIGALVRQGLAPAARALVPKAESVWELTKK